MEGYIDDIICFYESEENDIDEFVTYLNGTTNFLKFTAENSLTSVNFLDLTISKNSENRIQTSIYRNPIEKKKTL